LGEEMIGYWILDIAEKSFTTETQSAQRKKKARFGEDFLCELT